MRSLISLLLSLRLPVRQAARETRITQVPVRLHAVVALGSLFTRKIYAGKIKVWSLQSEREWLLPSLPRLPRGEWNRGTRGGLRHVGSSETQLSTLQSPSVCVCVVRERGFIYFIFHVYLFIWVYCCRQKHKGTVRREQRTTQESGLSFYPVGPRGLKPGGRVCGRPPVPTEPSC